MKTASAVLLLLCGSLGARQDEASRVEALVESLGADEIDVRDDALSKLIALGEGVLESLNKHRSHRDPEVAARVETAWRIIDRKRRIRLCTKDPGLRKKIEKWSRGNEGKAILVSRIMELRGKKFVPVAGFSVTAMSGEKNYFSDPSDEDGFFHFVLPPGAHWFTSVQWPDVRPLKVKLANPCRRWPGIMKPFEIKEFRIHPDLELVPRMKWKSPEDGTVLSIKDDAKLEWHPYPEVVRVRVSVGRVKNRKSGLISYDDLVVDVRKGWDAGLSDILAVAKGAFRPGEILYTNLVGVDRGGETVSRSAPRHFKLKK